MLLAALTLLPAARGGMGQAEAAVLWRYRTQFREDLLATLGIARGSDA